MQAKEAVLYIERLGYGIIFAVMFGFVMWKDFEQEERYLKNVSRDVTRIADAVSRANCVNMEDL